ncbi:MAG: M3 family metallopeptidase [Pseudobacteriovorax sp.]|nr:M3 family metallopeptidase [Pseudobacteriovorax sp.]
MNLKYLEPAAIYAMAKNLEEIELIANNPEPATFENTILAMERDGKELSRVFVYYGIWASNNSSPAFRQIQGKLAPKFAAFSSKISQNKKLFERIETVYKSLDTKSYTPEQRRVIELTYDGFARNGATLTGEKQKRYAEINKELSGLHVKFGNNLLADEENYVLFLEKSDLGGLPPSFVSAIGAAAEARGKPGKYAIANTRSAMEPFLKYSTNRKLRENVWRTYYSRGDNRDEFDNNDVIAEILKLRHERVQILGYENYASWRLADRMAQEPKNAYDLMLKVWPAAVNRVKEEVAAMQAVADAEGAGLKIEPWDYRFYAEKVRKKTYDLDSNEVKQYMQYDKLRSAMFYVADRLFDYKFTRVSTSEVPVFHPDVEVWEVKNKNSGELVGLWYLDAFAREGKRSGAWATSYRSHSTIDGKKLVLTSNNSNFIKGKPGETTLLSISDATTLFHEFGHSLHILASNVKYPTLNSGVRDFTEFQAQLLERWLWTDEVIEKFLVHVKTGKSMPQSLLTKIRAAKNFNQGFNTTEYLASSLVDMKLHTTDPTNIDPRQFEINTLKELGMPREIVMRHRTPQFAHVFSGEGYSAGYYSYLWADVLTADAVEAFAEAPNGYYDKELADRLVKYLFAPRNAIEPAKAYKQFRGRHAEAEALMKDRGFM